MKIKKHILSATLGLAALGTIGSSFAVYNTNMKAHDNDPVADQSNALNAWTKSINNSITVDMSGAQSTSDFSTLFQASFAFSITNFLQSPQGALWASEFSNDVNSVSAVSIYSLPTTDGTMPWIVNITLSLSNGTHVSVARKLMMNVTFLNLPTDTPSGFTPSAFVPSNITTERDAQIAALNALQSTNLAKYNFISSTMGEVSTIEDNAVLAFAAGQSDISISNYVVSTFSNYLNTNNLIKINTNDFATHWFRSMDPNAEFSMWSADMWQQNTSGELSTENTGIGMQLTNLYTAQEAVDAFALFTSVLPFDLVSSGSQVHEAEAATFKTSVMNNLVNTDGLQTIVQPTADNIDGQETYSHLERNDHILSSGRINTTTNGSFADWASDANMFANNFVAQQSTISLNETLSWAFINKAATEQNVQDWTKTNQKNPMANSAAIKKYYVEICNDAMKFALQDSAWAGTNISISGSVDIANYPDWQAITSVDVGQSQFANDGNFVMNFNNL